MTSVGPERDVILSDRSLECQSCGRRVAVHTSWTRTPSGHYVVTGWLIRNLGDGELVDELARRELDEQRWELEARAFESPRRRRRGWLRGDGPLFA